MYVILWEFYCKRSCKEKLLKANGVDGEWHRFFSLSSGYLGTEVFCNVNKNTHVVTIDRWSSKNDYENFCKQYHDEYNSIDRDLENLTHKEACLGTFLWEL